MLLERTNLEKALDREKMKGIDTIDVQRVIDGIIRANEAHYQSIKQQITSGKSYATNDFNFDLLASGNIYHLTHIKNICIDYRLRFLDSKYFKGDIPPIAISKIKQLEKEHETQLKGFKIVAPSKLFKLKDKNDPLLFVPLGNDYFYFIHKWGNDLHPLRKALMWPFKNIVNLTLTVFILSYFVTLMLPMGLFTNTSFGYEFWILFFFMFKSIAAIVIFYGFSKGKNFSKAIWRSKYYNA
ncbi:MAG: hypothetical protein KJO52_13845 [Maribacter sp.]|nr:hypothetical protein [Maribacter sp.]